MKTLLEQIDITQIRPFDKEQFLRNSTQKPTLEYGKDLKFLKKLPNGWSCCYVTDERNHLNNHIALLSWWNGLSQYITHIRITKNDITVIDFQDQQAVLSPIEHIFPNSRALFNWCPVQHIRVYIPWHYHPTQPTITNVITGATWSVKENTNGGNIITDGWCLPTIEKASILKDESQHPDSTYLYRLIPEDLIFDCEDCKCYNDVLLGDTCCRIKI